MGSPSIPGISVFTGAGIEGLGYWVLVDWFNFQVPLILEWFFSQVYPGSSPLFQF